MSTPKSELFTLFSPKAKFRIGRSKKNRGFTYTHKISEPKNANDKIDKFLKMLTPLETNYNILYTRDFPIDILDEEIEYLKDKMKK